jgi:hypothetical protein
MIVSSLRLALDDGWSLVPLKGRKAKGSEQALDHLMSQVDGKYGYLSGSHGSKFHKAIGHYLSRKLESVLVEYCYCCCK